MQFLLFDVGATLVFLAGYVTVVALRQRWAVPARAAKGERYR